MISSEAAAAGRPGRKEKIVTDLKSVIKELSGQDQSSVDILASFFDLGFDSLFLTQASQAFRSKFGVKVTFRQLLEELSTIDAVANYITQLKRSGYFQQVEIKESHQDTTNKAVQLFIFTLTAQFAPPSATGASSTTGTTGPGPNSTAPGSPAAPAKRPGGNT